MSHGVGGNYTISIMAVDGNALCRKFLSAAIGMTPGAELVGMAANGALALQKLRQQPADLLLLDFDSAEDLATLSALRKAFPELGIILVGRTSGEKAHLAVRAMQAGALHFLPKGDRPELPAAAADFSRHLAPLLRHFAIQRHLRELEAKGALAPQPAALVVPNDEHQASPAPRPAKPRLAGSIGLLVFAVSTGGPLALLDLIPALPGDLGLPVLVVQHMPANFTTALAETLAARSKLAVREPVSDEPVLRNTVYIAPGGRHMAVLARRSMPGLKIHLHDQPPVKSCRPSADVLFQSVAHHFDGQVLAVVMTGMGDDGCDGVRHLKQKGCYCLSQSRESCVVYGMPRAVDVAGLSDESVPLEKMASRITELVQK